MLSTLIASVVLITLALAAVGVFLISRLAASLAGTAALPLPASSRLLAGRFSWTTCASWELPARKSELTKQEVEDLLDWQEATGQPLGRVSLTANGHFTVSAN